MKNRAYLILLVCLFLSHPFAGIGEEDNSANFEQWEGWNDGSEGSSFEWFEYTEPETPSISKEARLRMEKDAEKMAYKIVEYKFKEIDRRRKQKEKEEKKRAREIEKEERKKQIEKEEAEGIRPKRVKDQWEQYLEELGLKDSDIEDLEADDDDEYYEEEFDLTGIDTVLLHQKMVEVEREMMNTREIDDAKRRKRKDGIILLKIKVPPCRYLNEVLYKREKFEFVYQLEFFNYYFERRYFYKRHFYNIDDPTRIVAKHVLTLLGNTTYRKTDFNAIIDSIETIVGYSVDKYLDQIISDINLEYFATGEVKIIYKEKQQSKIYSRIKPSNIKERSLGNIRFYTWDKKTIIEQMDASLYDASLPEPENPDSIYRLIHPPPRDTTSKKSIAKDAPKKKYKYALLNLFGKKKAEQSDSTAVDSIQNIPDDMTAGFLKRFFHKIKNLFVKEKPAQIDTESPPENPMDSATPVSSPTPKKEKKISRKNRKNMDEE